MPKKNIEKEHYIDPERLKERVIKNVQAELVILPEIFSREERKEVLEKLKELIEEELRKLEKETK
jgi:anaerobic glycerol-3-phosphate dehydrogenase